ncbi:MAG: ATP-binding protein [Bdellovibrionaceae bacterium]|nr:ATP-binding protein [Pseudobdellovibrionaceae bacterium]
MRVISNDVIEKKLNSINPHWSTGQVDEEYRDLPRRKYFHLFFPLATDFKVRRALVLMGPRRVGKTVMLFQTIGELIEKGSKPTSIAYMSLDEPLFYSMSLEALCEKYCSATREMSLEGKIIIFDEIQYLKKWDVQLKVLVDRHKNTKFLVSGSAAGALKRQSHESGAGRFTDFMLPPLTFCEYLDLLDLTPKLLNKEKETGKAVSSKDITKLNQEFLNYLNYGGFPEAIMNKSIREKPTKFIQQDIIDKVLLRDLPSIYGIEDIQELNRLFKYLTYQTGNEISYERLSQSSGVAKNTIKRYIEYLEAAYLIKVVDRVDENGKTFKRANFFKVYLTNPSMYAATYGIVAADDNETLGGLVETAIFSQWMHDPSWMRSLYYAKLAKNRGEVDIVFVDERFRIQWCLEVKWSDAYFESPAKLTSLKRFCEINEPKSVTVTTKTKSGQAQIGKAKIDFKETALVCFNIGNTLLRGK